MELLEPLITWLQNLDPVVAIGWIILTNTIWAFSSLFIGNRVNRASNVHSLGGWIVAMALYLYTFVYLAN